MTGRIRPVLIYHFSAPALRYISGLFLDLTGELFVTFLWPPPVIVRDANDRVTIRKNTGKNRLISHMCV